MNLYDFHDPMRHEVSDDELWDRLSDLVWDMGVICELLGLDFVQFAKHANKVNQQEFEKHIKTNDPALWLEAYFDHTGSRSQ